MYLVATVCRSIHLMPAVIVEVGLLRTPVHLYKILADKISLRSSESAPFCPFVWPFHIVFGAMLPFTVSSSRERALDRTNDYIRMSERVYS